MDAEGNAMRKFVLMILLAVAGNCEAANWADWLVRGNTFGEWFVVDRKAYVTEYANTATIRNVNNTTRMWDIADFTTEKHAGSVNAMSLKMEREYDCGRQQIRIIYIARYSGNMGEGDILGSDATVSNWRPVLLGTIGERLWRIACDRR